MENILERRKHTQNIIDHTKKKVAATNKSLSGHSSKPQAWTLKKKLIPSHMA